MKKILWSALLTTAFFVSACSDDNEDVIVPELPENDMNISVPNENNTGVWQPGMAYEPYPEMPENVLGEKVHVLVIDAEEHGQKILSILNNESWPWILNEDDKVNFKQVCFPIHKDIILNITESYDDFNPNYVACDIVNTSFSVFHLDAAKDNLAKFEDKEKFPEFPLVITSAGNGTNMFEQVMWDSCMVWGGLSWEDHVLPNMGWNPDGPFTEDQSMWFKPGDVGAAYVVQNVDNNGHKKDWIIVGRDDGYGDKPGPILKERWVCTYYSFDIEDNKIDGTSYSTPYVVKIAAEIKRRVPHYTNDEIAQLIFSTADDLGSPGCDDVYGWGRMNPVKIWNELARRGY